MDSPNLDRALRIKTNSVRGGTIEHIYFKNNLVKSLKHEVVCIDMMYEEGDAGPHRPVVRHIEQRRAIWCQDRRILTFPGHTL